MKRQSGPIAQSTGKKAFCAIIAILLFATTAVSERSAANKGLTRKLDKKETSEAVYNLAVLHGKK